jgi:hypothetical protein
VATTPKDAYDAWRQMLSVWEANVNEFANRSMASEEFSQALHQAGGATHGAREAFEAVSRRYLAAMGLPSRHEIEAIGERLHAIEAHLHRLTQLVEAMADKSGASSAEPAIQKPRRTRTPSQGGREPT